MFSSFLLPRYDKEAAIIPKGAARWLPKSDVAAISCPPLASGVPRISVIAHAEAKVKQVPANGFMVRAKMAKTDYSPDLKGPALRDEKIVYLIVGGAFILEHTLTTHPAFSLATMTKGRVFGLNYRKSLSAASAFPACLLDALAGYQYLIDNLGFQAKNILMCGDSAGANLILALVRYLDELSATTTFSTWGLPAALFLNSPWCDLTFSTPSAKKLTKTITGKYMLYVARPSHVQHFDDFRTNPYICPAITGFDLFRRLSEARIPAYISAGGAEMLLDEIVVLKDAMRQQGMDVTYTEIPNGGHSAFAMFERKEGPEFEKAWNVIKADFSKFWVKIFPAEV